MTLVVISFLVFLATASLALAGFYFLIEQPSERRRVKSRLDALAESTGRTGSSVEERVLRENVLSHIPKLNAILLRIPLFVKLEVFIRQAGTSVTPARILGISCGAGTLAFIALLIIRAPWEIALAGGLLASSTPFLVLAVVKQRRLAKFAEQFPDAIDLLARAVRAGHAFTTGLKLISEELPQPVAEEFEIVYEQQNLGLSLRDALNNLTVRVPLSDVKILATALQVQRESGGNLAEILDNLASVIRERFKLLRQVRVITAEGRLSLYALTALPFVTALLFYVSNPDYLTPLFEDPLGHQLLAAALVMQVLGYAVISKIVRIKV